MKASYESGFERGQDLVRYFLVGSIACGVGALFFTRTGTPVNVFLILLSMGLLIGMLICAWKFCRCPSCGRHIIAGALAVRVCPSCHRDLRSGKKVKKSRR